MSVISKMTFDNGSTKNLISSTFYGKCVTPADTATKTVTIGGWDESVKDNVSGATVHIYFENGNTATNPTLNIDSKGAHPIYVEDDVKATAFSAGIYSFTLVLFTVSSQETWCWLMQAKTDWSYISNKPSLDFIPTSQKGANSGVATLDANGKVPSGQLPSYVDDVLEYASRSLFPTTGTSGIIYIATDTNLTYRWSGSDYVEISPSLALGETASTAYRGDRGALAYSHMIETRNTTNPTVSILTPHESGLYKISTSDQGHVMSATAVAKSDITALGIPGDSGVTSITIKGTSPIAVDSESAITTTGTRTISLANSYGDTKNPYAAKVANTVLAGPASGNDTAPTFRQLVAADIPLLTKSKISDFPTSMPASDVSAWAKASTKPNYSLGEISGTDDLQEIEALSGTGLLRRVGSNQWETDSTAYLPTTGGQVTGDITLLKQVSSGAPGDSYGLIFQRGTLTDNYNDWMIIDSGGYLYFRERGTGSTEWTNRVTFNTTGNVSATSFSGSGASLTSLNASNLSSGTVPIARLPDLSSTYIPTSQKGAASGVAELDSNSKLPIVQSNYLFGKCTTSGSTAAKVASITGYSETNIANMEGVTVFIAFKNGNTADNPTLNISSSGAHPIVVGTYDDPANIGRFSNGLHAFTLVKAADNTYYWWVNEGRDTVPEAPTSEGYYALRVQSGMNNQWSSFSIPSAPTTGTLILNASGWSGNGPYSHSVTISGTTANSKIDLQPDSTVLAQMTTDGTTAIYIENNNGTLTAWAMGAAPTASLTIQYTKTEVA